jgi:predicted flap endonuclease-1-like 5' DNA nuclease
MNILKEEKYMATYKIADIEGIGPAYAEKLKKAGVKSVNGLLQAGGSRKGRKQLSEKSGIDETLILKWVNFADLYRIKGVGSEYSELLEKAGVDTIKELAKRKPEHLHGKMVEVNLKGRGLVRQLPGLKIVQNWIEQAKKIPPKVTY